jgi:hypothetical protein
MFSIMPRSHTCPSGWRQGNALPAFFPDEFLEVDPRSIKVVRQPMEEKVATIYRAKGFTCVFSKLPTGRCNEILPLGLAK